MIKSRIKRVAVASVTALMLLGTIAIPMDMTYTYADEDDGLMTMQEDDGIVGDDQTEGDPQEGDSQDDNLQDDDSQGDDPQPLNGWVTDEDGNTKYYVDDVAQTGLMVIEGSKYYFDENGKLCTGFIRLENKLYYFKSSGKATTAKGWVKISGYYRYGLGDGRLAVGHKKIGKKHYYFTYTSGKKASKGFKTDANGNKYYCKGKGKLATGWTAIGDRAYYFSKKSAKQLKDTKVGYLKIPKKGYLGKAYAQGIRVLNKKGWSLKAAYNYSSTQLKYYGKGMRKPTSEDYAKFGFTNKKGNCYVMAATFYVMAKLLKYDVHQVQGYVGPVCAHSWTTIKQGGTTYVYDPQFRNRTGRSGWKFKYGKRGTWRYNRYKNMN